MKKGFLNKEEKVNKQVKTCCVPMKDLFCKPCDENSTSNFNEMRLKQTRKSQIIENLNQLKRSEILNTSFLTLLKYLKHLIIDILDNNMKIIYTNHNLKGLFYQLIENETSFQQLLFPGSSPDTLNVLPKNLTELLNSSIFDLNYSKIISTSSSVFDGVKQRGIKMGQIMDSETQSILIPQIIQESLAREIVESVKFLGKKLSQTKAQSIPILALPPELEDEFRGNLTQFNATNFIQTNIQIIHNFMNPDWNEVIFDDCLRYLENESMSEMKEWINGHSYMNETFTSTLIEPMKPNMSLSSNMVDLMDQAVKKGLNINSSSSLKPAFPPLMAWIESNNLEEHGYCGLAEIVKQLHMLPFEINVRTDCAWELKSPVSGCTMLVYYPIDSFQPVRLDCNPRSNIDSGIRLSYSYAIGDSKNIRENAELSKFIYSNEKDSMTDPSLSIQTIPVQSDQLIIHSSRYIRNGRSRANEANFVLYFFNHGH